MKILHFIYDHPDNPWCGGGGAKRTWSINNILADKHDITVFCGGFPGAQEQDHPFRVRFLGSAQSYITSRLKYMTLSAGVDVSSYDLVVEDFSAYAPVFLRLGNKPRVTILHLFHGLAAFKYRGLFGLIPLFSENFLLRNRKNCVVVSEHLKKAIPGTEKVAVIGQGVDIPEGISFDMEKYVLSIGRIDVWHKGLDILLDAWAMIPARKRVLPLYIAGGGKDEAKIRDMIKAKGVDDIILTGRIDHDSAMKLIGKAAFLCMPSRIEGNPLVVAEAMACGKPIIASSISALTSLIQHEKDGLIVPNEDPGALAIAIRRLMTDLNLRQQLGKNAREKGKEFDWKTVAEKQERFYIEVLEMHN